MSTTITTGPDDLRRRRTSRARFGGVRRAAHATIGVAYLAAGVLLIAFEHPARGVETHILAWVLGHTISNNAVASTMYGDPSVAFGIDDHWYALRVTAECSIAFYAGAVLLLAGLLTMIPRLNPLRILVAALVSAVALVALNQVRMVMLAIVFSSFGDDAFEWAHSLGGSFLMIFGLAGCLFLFFRLVIRGGRKTPAGETVTADETTEATR
jgi:exosortase/archaeosortase family protein